MPPPLNPDNATVALIDRLLTGLLKGLWFLFGFQFSKNVTDYRYQVTIVSPLAAGLAVGTRMQDQIQITADADFVCTRIWIVARRTDDGALLGAAPAFADLAAADGGVVDAGVLIRLRDAGDDLQLENEAIDVWSAFNPQNIANGVLARPKLFARKGTVFIELESLKVLAGGAAAQVSFRVELIGWKLYDASQLDLTRFRA